MKRFLRRPPSFLVLGLLAAACGGSTSPPSSKDASRDVVQADAGGGGDASTDSGPAAMEVGGPPPTLVQPAPSSACKSLHLAIDQTTLYWTDEGNGKVLSSPVTGGAPTTIATGEDRPTWIAVANGNVFWAAGTIAFELGTRPLVIRTASSSGGVARMLAAPPKGVGGFAVSPDGATVFFGTDDTVQKVAAAGGAPALVATDADDAPAGMAINGAKLAYMGALTGRLHVIDLVDGQAATCVGQDVDPAMSVHCAIVHSGNGAGLTDTLLFQDNLLVWGDGSSVKISNTTSAVLTHDIIIEAASPIGGMTLLGETVVFSEAGSPDPFARATPVDFIDEAHVTFPPGGPTDAVPIATLTSGPRSMANDGARVYWASDDCTIMSLTP